MESNKKSSKFVDESKASLYKLVVEVGVGRALDNKLLLELRDIVFSSMASDQGEREFFSNVLSHKDLHSLEDWQLVKFIKIAEKANVKITLLGKPQLTITSTEESQQELITKLRDHYTRGEIAKLRHILDDETSFRDITQIFINLTIVKKHSHEDDKTKNTNKTKNITVSKNSDNQDVRTLSSYEQIYGKKEFFPISQLFSQPFLHYKHDQNKRIKKIQLPRKILIEGLAGIGKSVLCQYLTVIWARDVQEKEKRWWLDDTALVISISLRNLTNYDPKNCCLGEVVRRECFGIDDPKNPDYPSALQIEGDLKALADKVVLILDGFDEVAEWYEEYIEGSQQELSARSELLKNILLGDRHKHRVILTSRPSRVEKIKNIFDQRLETIGFKDEDIEKYVQVYFNIDNVQSRALLLNMRKNSNLWGIAHIPVNLALICQMWKQSEQKTEIPETMTMTELYSEAILWMLRRDWEKHPIWDEKDQEFRQRRMTAMGKRVKLSEKLSSDEIRLNARELRINDFERKLIPYSNKLRLLENLAWRAQISPNHNLLISGQQVVEYLYIHYGEELKNSEQTEILKEIMTIGLLESQFHVNERVVRDNYYYFPHLTFQEFFAAKFWVRKYSSEAEEEKREAENMFKQYKYYPRFEIVWWFASGLLGQQSSERIVLFFRLFQEMPREIVGMRHTGLLLKCLEESNCLANKEILSLLDEIIPWIEWMLENVNKTNDTIDTIKLSLSQSVRVYSNPIIMDKLCKYLMNPDKKSSHFTMNTLLFLVKAPSLNPKIIDAVKQCLSSKDNIVSQYAAKVLLQLPPGRLDSSDKTRIFTMLLDWRKVEISVVRMQALNMMSMLVRECTRTQIRTLAKVSEQYLDDEESHVRYAALEIIHKISWEYVAKQQVRELVLKCANMLKDKDLSVRFFAQSVLDALPWERPIFSNLKSGVDEIIVSLNEEKTRYEYCQLSMCKCVSHVGLVYRLYYTETIDRSHVIRVFLGALKSEESLSRYFAVVYLGRVSWITLNLATSKKMVKGYIKLCIDNDHEVRYAALDTLNRIPWGIFNQEFILKVLQNCFSQMTSKKDEMRNSLLKVIEKLVHFVSPDLLRPFIYQFIEFMYRIIDKDEIVRHQVFEILNNDSFYTLFSSSDYNTIKYFSLFLECILHNSCVLYFDLETTLIQYIGSKGNVIEIKNDKLYEYIQKSLKKEREKEKLPVLSEAVERKREVSLSQSHHRFRYSEARSNDEQFSEFLDACKEKIGSICVIC